MSALDGMLGRPGDPVRCRTIGEVSIHWWPSGNPQVDDWCLCGETQKRADNLHHAANGDHCTCWMNDEKPCCACGYEGDAATDCLGTLP